ncbi:MAG: malate dehydrogenase [Candidatus Omnitrophica bacterium]|nr:malate dehydrogenase [Candidatus Omnitrophota bacterium]
MINKISIIGAGSVGSALAFHLLNKLDLKDLVLVDVLPGLACGIAYDLEDTRQFIGFRTQITGSHRISDIAGSDIVVITAGKPRQEGMTRSDLLKINRTIVEGIAVEIKKNAPESVVVIVTNPLDLLVYFVQKRLGFDRTRVIGMGAGLDSARLTNLIYQKTTVDPASIHSLVIGPHSKDMLPLLEYSKYNNLPITDFLTPSEQEEVSSRVTLRGKEIVDQLKSRSAYFAPSLACADLVASIALDTHSLIPVSVCLDGEYGVSDIAMGVPCIISKDGIEKIIEIPLDARIKKTVDDYNLSFRQCTIS